MEIFYNKLVYFLEKFLNYKYWYLGTAIITVLAILFLTAPSYYALTKDFKPCSDCVSFQEEINRADHLLKPVSYPEFSHMANTQLRITVPVIAKLVGTRSKIVIFGIQEILGVEFDEERIAGAGRVPDAPHRFEQEPGAVLQRAAIFVRPLVQGRG